MQLLECAAGNLTCFDTRRISKCGEANFTSPLDIGPASYLTTLSAWSRTRTTAREKRKRWGHGQMCGTRDIRYELKGMPRTCLINCKLPSFPAAAELGRDSRRFATPTARARSCRQSELRWAHLRLSSQPVRARILLSDPFPVSPARCAPAGGDAQARVR